MNTIKTASFAAAMAVSVSLLLTACAGQGTAVSSTSVKQSDPLVNAPVGPIQGVSEQNLYVYKGIPYAEAPIGDNRWKPPVPKTPWSDVRLATEFGHACVQPSNKIPNIYSSNLGATSEDCLSLNIWTPENAENAPVFVWIHGGSLVKGSSKEDMYDGANLAKQGMIVVSINYRLGIFGFLAHPELSAESEHQVSGNYALLDQIEALHWINKNISSFGGDANNVTVAGESAGGLSVMYLLASPQARGLFAKAIMQSAYMISAPVLKEAKFGQFPAEALGQWLAGKAGATNLAELRQMDAQTLAETTAASGYFALPTVDGYVVPHQLVETFERGEQAPVPIIAGFNSGEIRSLTMLAPKAPVSNDEYSRLIRERYLDLSDDFLALYPATDLQESIYANTRDALYGWTAERLVRMQSSLGQSAYLYLYDHPYAQTDKYRLHAFHASELPYVFGNFDRTPKLWPKNPDSPQEHAFSTAMMEYWTSFAKTGQPKAQDQADWPAYGSEHHYMNFGKQPMPAANLFPGMYELHEETVCRRRAGGKEPWHWNTGIISPLLTDGECD
jgi:para-nitrobenzyl esterase